MVMHGERSQRLAGVLLGTALGDSLGLPYEGMSRRRTRRRIGNAPLRQRFLGGRGMVSDDTEHACLVGLALARCEGDVAVFQRELARELRCWFLALPAGLGWGTLRAMVKLCLGCSPERSGVSSAGNGACMRAPLIGAFAAHDDRLLVDLVRVSTRVTHRDPRAEQGALAVARAAALGVSGLPETPRDRIEEVRRGLQSCDLVKLLRRAEDVADYETEVLADELGLQRGVTGFVNHTGRALPPW